MVFLPGEHILQENITLRNISRLTFMGSSSPAHMSRIICIDSTFALSLEINTRQFLSCKIQLDATSVAFQNSRIENATSNNGGAIYAHNSIIIFRDSGFLNNTADHGGALYANSSTIHFEGETSFEGNMAAVAGGGILVEESSLTFHGSRMFINNRADRVPSRAVVDIPSGLS